MLLFSLLLSNMFVLLVRLSLCYVFLALGCQVYLSSADILAPLQYLSHKGLSAASGSWARLRHEMRRSNGSGVFCSKVQNLLLKVQTGLPRCQQNIKSCPISSTWTGTGSCGDQWGDWGPSASALRLPLPTILPLEIWSILSKTSATDSQASTTQQ